LRSRYEYNESDDGNKSMNARTRFEWSERNNSVSYLSYSSLISEVVFPDDDAERTNAILTFPPLLTARTIAPIRITASRGI
jgi:hypothetical protein